MKRILIILGVLLTMTISPVYADKKVEDKRTTLQRIISIRTLYKLLWFEYHHVNTTKAEAEACQKNIRGMTVLTEQLSIDCLEKYTHMDLLVAFLGGKPELERSAELARKIKEKNGMLQFKREINRVP